MQRLVNEMEDEYFRRRFKALELELLPAGGSYIPVGFMAIADHVRLLAESREEHIARDEYNRLQIKWSRQRVEVRALKNQMLGAQESVVQAADLLSMLHEITQGLEYPNPAIPMLLQRMDSAVHRIRVVTSGWV
jgi:hypothetical protein